MTDSVLPYSPHAEESLVGAALIDARVLDGVEVSPDDFFIRRHGMIWGALLELKGSGMSPDFVTIGTALQSAGQLEAVGGPAYLAKLINDTPSSMGAEDYAKIVKDYSARRRVLAIAQEMAKLAYDLGQDLESGVSKVMTDLTSAAYSGQGAVDWKHYINQAYEWIEERQNNPGGVWGIPTGYKDYDFLTGGLQSTELTIVSGPSGTGKSIFVMQMAMQMASARPKRPGALYSLEMLGRSVAVRAISAQSEIKSRTLKSERMSDDQWPVYTNAIEELEHMPIKMSDKEYWTTAGLRSDLARLKRQAKIEWAIVDYAYLLADGMGELNENERTQLIIANCKGIAKSLGIALVVIHSLNKLGELRGSGQVKYEADVILNVTAPDEMHPENIRCTFEKGRELDEAHKHFDLVRKSGIPKFVAGVLHSTDFRDPSYDWTHE